MTTVLLHLFRLLPFLVGGHRQLALENLASRAIVNSQAVEHWASDAAGFCLEAAEEVSRLQFGGTRVAAPGPRGRNPCWD